MNTHSVARSNCTGGASVTTINKLAHTLPNGFHDAELLALSIDYTARTLSLRFSLWVGTMAHPAGAERERYALAMLSIQDFQSCIIEPPQGAMQLDEHDQTTVDGVEFRNAETKLPKLDEGMFQYEFFGFNWNSSIYVAARTATLSFDSCDDEAYVAALIAQQNLA